MRWAALLVFYLFYLLLWAAIPIALGAWWWLVVPVLGYLSIPAMIHYGEQLQAWL
ncbi:MAG: hypothetical protein R2795_26440 [Saprospiraceae bacterium]